MSSGVTAIIAGSREGFTLDTIIPILDKIQENAMKPICTVVSGCATGVDTLGETWAYSKGIRVERFPADWNTYGKAAGAIRNTEMKKFADVLIAFWDEKSNGTLDMIRQMQKAGKPVIVYNKSAKRIKVT